MYADPDVWTHLVVTLVPQGVTQTRVERVQEWRVRVVGLLCPGLVNNGASFLIGGLRDIQRYRGLIDELQIYSSAFDHRAHPESVSRRRQRPVPVGLRRSPGRPRR